jgi:hypothetical protein
VKFNVANRKVHHWASFFAAIPVLVIIASGILLQMKKQWDWVQPPEHRGTGTVPAIDLHQLMTALQGVPALGVTGWDDVDRIDVRPGRGIAKVTLMSRWEAQIDLGTGKVLQTAFRRSDLIESIHDGSFFAGDWTKLGLFLPAGLVLMLLWLTGMWMVWFPYINKRRKRALVRPRAAVIMLVAAGLSAGAVALAAQRPVPILAIDPLVGHWETRAEDGETIVVADARKWKTEPAATPFPVAAVRGVTKFTDGVLSVKFKLVGGDSDQIAGLVFGLQLDGTYYYARYNTKDGNVALWQFVNGDRKRIAEGADHLQLPLQAWHDLRVEVRGATITATVNDKLRLQHTLPAPVSGRVGFYTKRDSITEFKGFSAKH